MHASRRIAASALRNPAAKRFASSAANAGGRHQIEVSSTCTTSKNSLRRPAPAVSHSSKQLHQNLQSGVSANRYYSNQAASPTESKQWSFEEVRALLSPSSSSPTSKPLLLDVREPHEYAAGHIPSALNMPLQSAPDALMLSAADFADKFGFAKPAAGDELLLYCKSGVRSASSAEIAKSLGYARVGEYKGSWKDWEAKGGESEV